MKHVRPVVAECELPDPPEKVWKALTTPELLSRWLLPNDIQPEVGNRFRLQPEAGGAIQCEVLAAEHCRLLRYSWRGPADELDARGEPLDSVVTFELTRTPAGGTRLRVVHEGLATAQVVSFRSPTRGGTRTRAEGLRWAA
jgi:uncharacterized protein YndB with AHSA1/START domain